MTSALSGKQTFEFKPLFDVILADLRAKESWKGDQEMLRLRVYEKLQNFVQGGMVKKEGKVYQGSPSGMKALRLQIQTWHLETANRLTASRELAKAKA